MNTHCIQPNFEIPDGYRRVFVFSDGKQFKHLIIVSKEGIQSASVGSDAGFKGKVFDFLEESIMAVRIELGEA